MLTLYRTSNLLSYWVAHSTSLGWVMFPAKADGWSEQKPYYGDTDSLMRIPQRLGFNTGFPHPDATPVRAINERGEHVAGKVVEIQRRVA